MCQLCQKFGGVGTLMRERSTFDGAIGHILADGGGGSINGKTCLLRGLRAVPRPPVANTIPSWLLSLLLSENVLGWIPDVAKINKATIVPSSIFFMTVIPQIFNAKDYCCGLTILTQWSWAKSFFFVSATLWIFLHKGVHWTVFHISNHVKN